MSKVKIESMIEWETDKILDLEKKQKDHLESIAHHSKQALTYGDNAHAIENSLGWIEDYARKLRKVNSEIIVINEKIKMLERLQNG